MDNVRRRLYAFNPHIELLSRPDGAPEGCGANLGQHENTLVRYAEQLDASSARLCQGFDKQHTWYDREFGEVPLEKPILRFVRVGCDNSVSVNLDIVHEEERGAVRYQILDPVHSLKPLFT
jgi:hypothetical protein